MTLQKLVQQPGTDLNDEHNETNMNLLDAIVDKVNAMDTEQDQGHYGSAEIKIATKPTATDTVTIGADVYEFGGAGANINVTIGADAASARANLIVAINTLGTEKVFADNPTTPATSVRIQQADRVGGTPEKGVPDSLVLASSLTAGTDGWNAANLNERGQPELTKRAAGRIVVNATNLGFPVYIHLDFTPVSLRWTARSATGAYKTTTATGAITGNKIVFDFAAGGTDLAATDIVDWEAVGN